MSKVFRLHTGGDGEDWFPSQAYDKKAIEGIVDPDGSTPRRQITSIPSPFARIDLVKSAFKVVTDAKKLNGDTIHHQLISHALDLAELMFNRENFKQELNIVQWDVQRDLPNLVSSNNPKHRLLGDTLELFLDQDDKAYNFDLLQGIYILLYGHKVIGGTSPSTLFFTTANSLEKIDINLGRHQFFGNQYVPLYNRESEFQEYLYEWVGQVSNFSSLFKEFAAYMKQSLDLLEHRDDKLYNKIKSATKVDLKQKYDVLTLDTANQRVEILGNTFYSKKKNLDRIKEKSSFIINTDKHSEKNIPMALSDGNHEDMIYVSDNWDKNITVPYVDNEPDWNKRVLPGTKIEYPYIVVSDLLEPYIFQLPYELNDRDFFSGNIDFTGEETQGLSLPIKKEYFRLFGVDDLKYKKMPDGKRHFEMTGLPGGGVSVILRIPLKKGYVTMERLYLNQTSEGDPSQLESENQGVIIRRKVALAIWPSIVFPDKVDSHYRIHVSDSNKDRDDIQLTYYREDSTEALEVRDTIGRSHKHPDNIFSQISVLESRFDIIQLTEGRIKGILIPEFEVIQNGNQDFSFAIDFGTTNTHIEYSVRGQDPKPFEITQDDRQIATTYMPDSHIAESPELMSTVLHEFLPPDFAVGSRFHFPIRTALSERTGLNFTKSNYALADFNIPFLYEKEGTRSSVIVETNLKWANYLEEDQNEKKNERRVERFFEELLLLVRNKVLLNQGNLENTNLIWSYPSSMVVYRRDKLGKLWKELYQKYFGKRDVLKISESVAPFYYYNKVETTLAADRPVLSIDIGGGTCDLVLFLGKDPIFLSSCRFGANAILGDFYGGSADNNGLILRYGEKIRDILNENQLGLLVSAFDEIKRLGKSEDLISFFFSLEESRAVKEKNIELSFHDMLTDDNDLKIIFLMYYAAIVYHSASLIKAQGQMVPRYLTFSGTASKVLRILDQSDDLKRLIAFTKKIFEKVSGEKVNLLDIKLNDKPKEITSKGCIISMKGNGDKGGATRFEESDQLKKILLGTEDQLVIDGDEMKYGQLSADMYESVVTEVRKFVETIFSIHDELNFQTSFGVMTNRMADYRKALLSEDLTQYLKQGEIKKLDEELTNNAESSVEESLFFYPIIGVLKKLSDDIGRGTL